MTIQIRQLRAQARDLAREALTFQQFFAPGGKLRLRLPPVSGMILI